MSDSNGLLCYNKGCNKRFTEDQNLDDACQHHPGAPFFHDGKKKWTCCEKGSVDFTEFLNVPGCTFGRHNPTKPPAAPPPVQNFSHRNDEEIIVKAPLPPKREELAERPSVDEPLVVLRHTVDNKLLEDVAKKLEALKTYDANKSEGDTDTIQLDTACQNHGCTARYNGPESNAEICRCHPGFPIFHEGMKFWSCCQRKTTEFDNFMAQEGCTEDKHEWRKRAQKMCRTDWHQGKAGHVTVDIYSKLSQPVRCKVEANGVLLKVAIDYEAGTALFERSWRLYGVICPSESVVNYKRTKVEICLKKRDLVQWPALELPA